MKETTIKCKKCGADVGKKDKVCPNCSTKLTKPFYVKWWFWVIVVVIIVGFASGGGDNNSTKDVSTAGTQQSQSETPKQETDTESKKDEPTIPTEYKSALKKAEMYSETMHMSKKGIYDQLTSEYGEKFSAEAAQYAVDNMTADWNANALAKAKDYQESMSMSPEAIRDQLKSDYGEKFTAEEADYAVANLD